MNEGYEKPSSLYQWFGISNFYFINRTIVYLTIFFLFWTPLVWLTVFLRCMLWKDPESPVLLKWKDRFSNWAFWAFPMRFFFVTSLDAMLVAMYNLKTFLIEEHIWNHYMEASFILSCLFFACLILFMCCLPLFLCRISRGLKELPIRFNAASKGLSKKWRIITLFYFLYWFGVWFGIVLVYAI